MKTITIMKKILKYKIMDQRMNNKITFNQKINKNIYKIIVWKPCIRECILKILRKNCLEMNKNNNKL